MSFILDALKKLEQKRQRGSVPDITAIHDFKPQEIKKRPVWPYLILAGLVLNAFILAAWLRPWGPDKQNASARPLTEQQHTSTTTEASKHDINNDIPSSVSFTGINKRASNPNAVNNKSNNTTAKTSSVKETQQKQQLPAKTTGLKAVSEGPSQTVTTVDAKASIKTSPDSPLPKPSSSKTLKQQPIKESPSTGEAQPAEANKTVPVTGIPEISQLPQNVQIEMPQLKVFGHIYSDSPNTRLININGDIYKEGDTVAKNVKVEEITETGVVLNYNGTRFRLRAF